MVQGRLTDKRRAGRTFRLVPAGHFLLAALFISLAISLFIYFAISLFFIQNAAAKRQVLSMIHQDYPAAANNSITAFLDTIDVGWGPRLTS